MSEQPSGADKSLAQQTSPYGYAYWEWVAREDPEYARAHIPLSELSVGEGKALAIKYREMVIIGILAFRGASQEGLLAHMKRAIQHGATKRELLEAMESAAVPGGGPTFATGHAPSCSSTPRGHSRTGSGWRPCRQWPAVSGALC
jgi:alkylhydroperoxidase/carboxymuconolactone decarboxylase family protein YurZ